MRVAIVGAGPSGLTSIKCCLDEGLEPVCFEKGMDLGGLWRYEPEEEDHNCVYNSCVMISSREMSCYSDFPVPKDYPLYLPHSSVKTYLNLYVDNFGLRPYIRYNTKIEKIIKTRGPNMNDQWKVTYEKRVKHEANGDEIPLDKHISDRSASSETNRVLETEIFDAVLVCSGCYCKPNIPKFLGADKFLGEIIHSSSYRDIQNFYGKDVLVIGIGDSGSAISSELSQHGGKVYLSTRCGSWITSRLQPGGIPSDQFLLRRFFFDLPTWLLDWICTKLMNLPYDHHALGLLPKFSYLKQRPVINDYLPYKILSGSVLIKPNIVQLTGKEAHFEDGSVAENIDVVILATGYQYDFPFLEDGCVQFKAKSPILYKHTFPVEENPTLAFIGFPQVVGAIFAPSELQARLATRVFKGATKLPRVKDMEQDIKEEMERKEELYNPEKNITSVHYVPYCDELAGIIGCKPRLSALLFSDPLLAFRCYFGPCFPPQYRLTGPGAWSGARQAIMASPQRNGGPFKPLLFTAAVVFLMLFIMLYVVI